MKNIKISIKQKDANIAPFCFFYYKANQWEWEENLYGKPNLNAVFWMVSTRWQLTLESLGGRRTKLGIEGIRKVWMPPAFKGTGSNDVGYGVRPFDLEVWSKGPHQVWIEGRILRAIEVLKRTASRSCGCRPPNHKAAADYKSSFTVVEVDPNDRTKVLSEPSQRLDWLSSQVQKSLTMTSNGTGTTSWH